MVITLHYANKATGVLHGSKRPSDEKKSPFVCRPDYLFHFACIMQADFRPITRAFAQDKFTLALQLICGLRSSPMPTLQL